MEPNKMSRADCYSRPMFGTSDEKLIYYYYTYSYMIDQAYIYIYSLYNLLFTLYNLCVFVVSLNLNTLIIFEYN